MSQRRAERTRGSDLAGGWIRKCDESRRRNRCVVCGSRSGGAAILDGAGTPSCRRDEAMLSLNGLRAGSLQVDHRASLIACASASWLGTSLQRRTKRPEPSKMKTANSAEVELIPS